MVGTTRQFDQSAGTSFKALLQGEDHQRSEVFFEQEESRGVRTVSARSHRNCTSLLRMNYVMIRKEPVS